MDWTRWPSSFPALPADGTEDHLHLKLSYFRFAGDRIMQMQRKSSPHCFPPHWACIRKATHTLSAGLPAPLDLPPWKVQETFHNSERYHKLSLFSLTPLRVLCYWAPQGWKQELFCTSLFDFQTPKPCLNPPPVTLGITYFIVSTHFCALGFLVSLLIKTPLLKLNL